MLRTLIGHNLFPFFFWFESIVQLASRDQIIKKARKSAKTATVLLIRRCKVFEEILIGTESCSNPDENNHYCFRCGKCCWFSSGYPEFSESWPFPERWKSWFSEGCGYGQVFCPFLCQEEHTDLAYCAIYPHRPIVCRRFGKEECEYLLEGLEDEKSDGLSILKRRLFTLLRNNNRQSIYPFKAGKFRP